MNDAFHTGSNPTLTSVGETLRTGSSGVGSSQFAPRALGTSSAPSTAAVTQRSTIRSFRDGNCAPSPSRAIGVAGGKRSGPSGDGSTRLIQSQGGIDQEEDRIRPDSAPYDDDWSEDVPTASRFSQQDLVPSESESDDDSSSDPDYDADDRNSSMHVSDLLKSSPLSAVGGRAKLEERIDILCGKGGDAAPFDESPPMRAELPVHDEASNDTDRKEPRARFERAKRELDRGDEARIREALGDDASTSEELRDAVSTALMDAFRKSTGRGTFGLLYELNAAHLLLQVSGRLRRYSSKADPGDVLQEVFFNVYRYPHRFDAGRPDAFRVWTAMIVRNTVLKHLRSRSTGGGGRLEVPFEDLSDQPVADGATPLSGVLEDEASAHAAHAYVTYLQLYIEFYSMLSDRERLALHLVEVDRISYRDAAARLEIKLENLKMVIFRARRKIHRAMRRVFDGLSPDCKPARTGSSSIADSAPSGARSPFSKGDDSSQRRNREQEPRS